MSQPISQPPHEQLSECTSRLWAARSFLSVLYSAVLYDQPEQLGSTTHEMLYDDLLKYVLDELQDIACAVEEIADTLDPALQKIQRKRAKEC